MGTNFVKPTDESIQTLWGGYGRLSRRGTEDGSTEIVKDVRWPVGKRDRSHARKVRSYEVEARWYGHWRDLAPLSCRTPACLGIQTRPDGMVLVLEDLDAAGFPRRSTLRRKDELHAALAWLARFHAAFLGVAPDGLWKEGSYWHLATRPDELEAMPPGPLRDAAADLDRRLSRARFRTIVHGDAKPDNFCLGRGDAIAMVDFQYVGGGCGMRDVAYLLDCVHDDDFAVASSRESIDLYFKELRAALPPAHGPLADEIEAEWRSLLPVAWLDYQRFLQGWSPAYSRPSARLGDRIREELRRLPP